MAMALSSARQRGPFALSRDPRTAPTLLVALLAVCALLLALGLVGTQELSGTQDRADGLHRSELVPVDEPGEADADRPHAVPPRADLLVPLLAFDGPDEPLALLQPLADDVRVLPAALDEYASTPEPALTFLAEPALRATSSRATSSRRPQARPGASAPSPPWARRPG